MSTGGKQAVDELARGLVDLFSPAGEDSSRLVDEWRRTLERPGLGTPERLIVAVAVEAALGQSRFLELTVRAAGIAGVSNATLREVLLFLVPYCGWAVVLNAIPALPPGLQSPDPIRGLDREELRALGQAKARDVNPQFEKVAANLAARDPGLLDHLTETAYGAVYGRPGLDLKSREIIAVALLAVSGHEPQLRYHIRGALNVGASPEEVRETLIQTHLHAGWPVALAGLEIFESTVK